MGDLRRGRDCAGVTLLRGAVSSPARAGWFALLRRNTARSRDRRRHAARARSRRARLWDFYFCGVARRAKEAAIAAARQRATLGPRPHLAHAPDDPAHPFAQWISLWRAHDELAHAALRDRDGERNLR